MPEFDAMEFAKRLGVRVIADYKRNGTVEFARMMAMEKVRQAMQIARHEDRNASFFGCEADTPAHFEPGRNLRKFVPERIDIKIGDLPFDAHEEETRVS